MKRAWGISSWPRLLCIACAAVAVQTHATDTNEIPSDPRTFVSSRGIVSVRSDTQPNVLAGLNWVEANLATVSYITGITMPSRGRQFHLHMSAASTSRIVRATATNSIRGKVFMQRMTLLLNTGTPPPEVNQLLCSQILHGMAWKPDAAPSTHPAFKSVTALPSWFTDGIYRNLTMIHRTHDASVAITLWQSGKLASLAHAFSSDPETRQEPAPEISGFFLNWILSQTNHTQILESFFQEIRSGQPVDMFSLAMKVDGCSNRVTMEETWEKWILRQRMKVNRLGVTSQAAMDRLRSSLVIYSGMHGVPRLHESSSRISLVELAALHREPWVANVCDQKCKSLRLISLGKSKEFVDTVELYCAFFEAVKKGSGSRTLQQHLQQAHQALMALDGMGATIGYTISTERTEAGDMRSAQDKDPGQAPPEH